MFYVVTSVDLLVSAGTRDLALLLGNLKNLAFQQRKRLLSHGT